MSGAKQHTGVLTNPRIEGIKTKLRKAFGQRNKDRLLAALIEAYKDLRSIRVREEAADGHTT